MLTVQIICIGGEIAMHDSGEFDGELHRLVVGKRLMGSGLMGSETT